MVDVITLFPKSNSSAATAVNPMAGPTEDAVGTEARRRHPSAMNRPESCSSLLFTAALISRSVVGRDREGIVIIIEKECKSEFEWNFRIKLRH